MIENIAVYAPDRPFVLPYFTAALPACGVYSLTMPDGNLQPENKLAKGRPELYIMVSATDIYGDRPMESADEQTPADPSACWGRYEKDFTAFAEAQGARAVILRCADLVCTGMQGFPRHLVDSVWRGTFFHFPGNDAKRSVVHAVDLGRIAAAMASGAVPNDSSLVYNVTDGADPTIHDLAEALAYRLNNKRISTLSTRPQQWIGRMLYGREKYGRYTTSRTFSSAKLELALAFRPTVVTDYLRTHVYDEKSL